MKKILFITAVALVSMGCNKREVITHIKNPIYVDENENEDCIDFKVDTLLIVKRVNGDSIVVDEATDDDCRCMLENHGKG